jgi:hypothetical protein
MTTTARQAPNPTYRPRMIPLFLREDLNSIIINPQERERVLFESPFFEEIDVSSSMTYLKCNLVCIQLGDLTEDTSRFPSSSKNASNINSMYAT